MSDVFGDGDAREDENAIDLTPMLDVVFIMLIFFIVTATFVKEAGVDVERPLASTAERQDLANILIAITPEDDVWIDGNRVDVRDMSTLIKRLHAENPQGSVVIQADRDSTHKTLKQVMDAVQKAGVGQVAVAAENEG
ncbi:biopolymer transport protein [Oceanococcus atlanticus]|uniref:Biopolymer transport protein n=1 Tax=Oceanococcus atlanticus TaxID=1317117 RepID=A0A1Y1SF36_9GAMM|nr:biopolymer transporter ExbD [Oceanococcus atlanticus]ORE88218.1 biopolymer transport protein [Oceanococcus atlanticus]RZO85689.1 MAG: biopolymer transporter ExbD [Oceanococcus sp.]